MLACGPSKQADSSAAPRAGFSLVELTVTLVLAGVIATMAVPRVSKTVENAQVNQGVAGMRSIWLAQRRYRLQHEEFAPSMEALVDQGFADHRLLEKDEPFHYVLSRRGKDGLRIYARRAISSGWRGELSLDELGQVRGQVIDGDGNVVEP